MKTFLISYVIFINLVGFMLMGIDKRKARRRKFRIAERTLFLISLIGGSIGTLIGMYIFRHKTRHLSFVLGIPLILIFQLLLMTALFSWNQKRMGSPTQAVEYELELIQDLDKETIQSFVSYENITNSQGTAEETGDEASEAVQLFFRDFSYNILTETIEGDTATVSVNVSNIDAESLARDLRTMILRESVSSYPYAGSGAEPSISDYYRLLRDTLKNHDYETAVTTAYFHLAKDPTGWTILADTQLEDELTGGFISWMNDPLLLSPETVLSAYLDTFSEFDGSQWMDFLNVSDVFATYNTDYYPLIDTEYFHQISESFDYELLRCQTEGDTASVDVRITSIDLKSVLTAYKKSLLSYASTTQSIRDDDVTVSNEISRLLLEALQQNEKTASTDISMHLSNNGRIWNVIFDEAFTNALMGDVSQAIDTFNEITNDSNS